MPTNSDFMALCKAAYKASAVLSHAYNTVLEGGLSQDAHDAYQNVDRQLCWVLDCKCGLLHDYAPTKHLPDCKAGLAFKEWADD